MYVCVCHALNDRQIKAACPGACHPVEVQKRLGVRPQCGRCLSTIRDIMMEEAEKAALPMAAE